MAPPFTHYRVFAARKSVGLVVSAVIALLAGTGFAQSAPNQGEMDEIIVTGTRQQTVWDAPRSVAVITANDIQRSSSSNLVDLLAREANVNLRSFFGSDKFAGVDIRGQGDTFVSNVLVLVDGVRMNAVDLSGADFSSIPLDQIERIEIIRGANAVRYGDGAVGGVINIRTRRFTGQPSARVRVSGGGFDTYTSAFDFAAGWRGLSLKGNASVYDSDGYRDNGTFHKKDAALELRFEHAGWLDAYVRSSLHADRFGIPGPVSLLDFSGSDTARRSTQAPQDRGRTVDRRYRAGFDLEFGRFGHFGHLHAMGRFRNRTNPFVIGFTPLLTIPDQQSTIASVARNYEASYTMPVRAFALEHEFIAGYENQVADYERRENGRGRIDASTRRVGDVVRDGYFVASRIALPAGLGLDFGYRRDRFRLARREEALREVCDTVFVERIVEITKQREIFPGVFIPLTIPATVEVPIRTNCRGELFVTSDPRRRWRNEAWEAGLRWQINPMATTYVSFHRSFRNPNIDELTLASESLGPQRAEHWELGLRLRNGRVFEGALSLFHMRAKNEIFFGFDVASGRSVNFNLEQGTTRQGFEIEIKVWPLAQLKTWSNLSYIDVRLDGTDAVMPLVPRNQFALGMDWQITPQLSLSSAFSYTGKRFDGNDFDNDTFERLAAYHVLDAKLQWAGRGYSVAWAANNLTDEVYATAGFSETLYPMPPRHFMIEFSLTL